MSGESHQQNSTLGRNSTPKRVVDIIPFRDIAKLLDRVTDLPNGKEKMSKISNYFNYFRDFYKKIHNGSLEPDKADGDSLYPLVRILLPAADRGRAAYGFKAHILGKIFAQILGLDKESADGKRLLNFKDPKQAGPMAGDFGTVIFSVLEKRFSNNENQSEAGPTVSDLHAMLDKLAKTPGERDVNIDAQRKILQNFVRKLTALEGKWLSRILLKQMRHGLTTNQIFQCIHPQARELHEKISNLEQVCQRLNDPIVQLAEAQIGLFDHCKPMLCARLDIVGNSFEESSQETRNDSRNSKDKIMLPAPPFVVENKWDGERFQIHFDGTKFKYSSRNGFNYTAIFDETLTVRIRPQLRKGLESFILDGEMMAFHKRTKTFTTKGQNIDVKTMKKDNPNHCPVFVAFDILFFNGEVLTDQPLRERISILKEQVFVPKEGVILISEQKQINSKEEVMEALNEAIDNLEEGIVVKDLNSVYEVGKRPTTWLKIKPEYVEGSSVDDLDLLILGAYYSESLRQGGCLTHFMLGLIDKTHSQTNFYPLARVGSGRLRNPDLKSLVADLQPHLVETEVASVKFTGRKRPDWYIDPKNSVVVQVKATEIIYHDANEVKYTLRFPRIIKVRRDKPWDEVMSVKEFHQLRESCSGKLAKRKDGKAFHRKAKNIVSPVDSDDDQMASTSSVSVPKKLRQGQIPEPAFTTEFEISETEAAAADTFKTVGKQKKLGFKVGGSNQKQNVVVNVFDKKLFCVYGSEPWKSEMESSIRSSGGEITQNPVNEMFAIVGEKDTMLRVNLAIKSQKYNVIKSDWILRSIDKKVAVQFCPSDFWYCTQGLKKQFDISYDEFGDSFTKKVTLTGVKSLISRVTKQSEIEDCSDSKPPSNLNYEDNQSDIKREIIEEIFGEERKRIKWSFLNGMKVAFLGEFNAVLAAKLEFYGGKVAVDEAEEGVTHVVTADPLSPRKKHHLRAFVVKQNWLEDSLEKKEILDEFQYMIE